MLDDFIETCRTAALEPDAIAKTRAAVEELVESPADLAVAYPAPADCDLISGYSDYVYADEALTVCMVHTPPGIEQPPHDHLMTAIIGGYAGVELHRHFRRTPAGDAALAPAGTTDLAAGDVLTIGTAGVHAIDAAPGQWSSAIHIYLGALGSVARSVFHPDTFEEHPLTMAQYDEWCRPSV